MKLIAAASLFSVMAFAETWTGTLVDASCMDSKKSSAQCSPTSSTSAFALVLADGKAVKLDDAGNTKAADAIKNNADRSKNSSQPGAAAATTSAKVTGTLSGDTIKTDSVEVQ